MSTHDVTRRAVRTLLALAAVFVFPACDDGLGPGELAGNYILTQVNGESPPHVIGTELETSDGITTSRTLEILSGSVSVASDGSVTLNLTGRMTTVSGGSSETNSGNATESGSLVGGNLAFAADSIDVESERFGITGGNARWHVIMIGLERTTPPFDVALRLQFEKVG